MGGGNLASGRPGLRPNEWPNDGLIAAWIGHSTLLLNFFGVTVLTDPVLFPRIGIRLLFLTIGPKRLTKPALQFGDLPPIAAHQLLESNRTLGKIVLRFACEDAVMK